MITNKLIDRVKKHFKRGRHDKSKSKLDKVVAFAILGASTGFNITEVENPEMVDCIDHFKTRKEAEIARNCLVHFYIGMQEWFYGHGMEDIQRWRLNTDNDNLRITAFHYYGEKYLEELKLDELTKENK